MGCLSHGLWSLLICCSQQESGCEYHVEHASGCEMHALASRIASQEPKAKTETVRSRNEPRRDETKGAVGN